MNLISPERKPSHLSLYLSVSHTHTHTVSLCPEPQCHSNISYDRLKKHRKTGTVCRLNTNRFPAQCALCSCIFDIFHFDLSTEANHLENWTELNPEQIFHLHTNEAFYSEASAFSSMTHIEM